MWKSDSSSRIDPGDMSRLGGMMGMVELRGKVSDVYREQDPAQVSLPFWNPKPVRTCRFRMLTDSHAEYQVKFEGEMNGYIERGDIVRVKGLVRGGVIDAKEIFSENTNAVIGRKGLAEGCFVATAVYGSYECREVLVLRRFRDRVLRRIPGGLSFIRLYYRVSPAICPFLNNSESASRAIRKLFLDPMVGLLQPFMIRETRGAK